MDQGRFYNGDNYAGKTTQKNIRAA